MSGLLGRDSERVIVGSYKFRSVHKVVYYSDVDTRFRSLPGIRLPALPLSRPTTVESKSPPSQEDSPEVFSPAGGSIGGYSSICRIRLWWRWGVSNSLSVLFCIQRNHNDEYSVADVFKSGNPFCARSFTRPSPDAPPLYPALNPSYENAMPAPRTLSLFFRGYLAAAVAGAAWLSTAGAYESFYVMYWICAKGPGIPHTIPPECRMAGYCWGSAPVVVGVVLITHTLRLWRSYQRGTPTPKAGRYFLAALLGAGLCLAAPGIIGSLMESHRS